MGAKTLKPQSDLAILMLNLFGGDRQPLPKKFKPLIRVSDGYQKQFPSRYISGPNIRLELPFSDGIADNMTVLVSLDGRYDAGFSPCQGISQRVTELDLILVPKPGRFQFDAWDQCNKSTPTYVRFSPAGAMLNRRSRNTRTWWGLGPSTRSWLRC